MKKNIGAWLSALALIALAGCTTQMPRLSDSVRQAPSAAASAAQPASSEAAPVTPSADSAHHATRPNANTRLGTRWGEGVESKVKTVRATRVTPDHPDGAAVIQYDAGRARNSSDAAALLTVPLANGRVELSIIDANGNKLRMHRQRGNDAIHLTGRDGEHYQLSFTNRGSVSYEIVATVDGLDVISGQPGTMSAGGYIIYPGRTLNIEGFRKNNSEVAAFRFSAVSEAYASNTPAGDPNNAGVIGAAIFEVKIDDGSDAPVKRAPPSSSGRNPFPGHSTSGSQYSPPPAYKN